MTSDEELMRQIKQRDAAALGHLYDRHGDQVFSLAAAILRDETRAQEVTQDVFIKIWTHPERYLFDDNRFSAWLLTMTRNQSIDRLRRERRQVESAFSMDNDDAPQVQDARQTAALQWEEMSASMHDLPDEQRQVIGTDLLSWP